MKLTDRWNVEPDGFGGWILREGGFVTRKRTGEKIWTDCKNQTYHPRLDTALTYALSKPGEEGGSQTITELKAYYDETVRQIRELAEKIGNRSA